MIRIPILHLIEGWQRMQLWHPVEELELVESGFRGQVEIHVDIERRGGQYLVLLQTSAQAELICDRCLERYSERLIGSYSILYAPEAPPVLSAEEFRPIRVGVRDVDITDDVRQTVLLSIPLKQVCREDCLGLCPECGSNLNLSSHRAGCPRRDPVGA
ncbi:MAG: DUF177 domain-containing protein [Bacteroidetes bacterium]|nr:DUF177 domain-containing protein [Rhodothermia bacterium]MCX7906049.1 DUF177 domain-containing protein [Bacteroidota bacterium]MDW8285861.1 DUF177 domain-containing protein [Bacteroidota bacterium]